MQRTKPVIVGIDPKRFFAATPPAPFGRLNVTLLLDPPSYDFNPWTGRLMTSGPSLIQISTAAAQLVAVMLIEKDGRLENPTDRQTVLLAVLKRFDREKVFGKRSTEERPLHERLIPLVKEEIDRYIDQKSKNIPRN